MTVTSELGQEAQDQRASSRKQVVSAVCHLHTQWQRRRRLETSEPKWTRPHQMALDLDSELILAVARRLALE